MAQQSKKALQSPARRPVPVVAKRSVKKVSPTHTTALGANIGQESAALKHVLNELRATKQQLSQLRSIQTQLTRVQLQLDQQLQVLRRSMGTSASGEVRPGNTDSDGGTEHKTDNTGKQHKEVGERA